MVAAAACGGKVAAGDSDGGGSSMPPSGLGGSGIGGSEATGGNDIGGSETSGFGGSIGSGGFTGTAGSIAVGSMDAGSGVITPGKAGPCYTTMDGPQYLDPLTFCTYLLATCGSYLRDSYNTLPKCEATYAATADGFKACKSYNLCGYAYMYMYAEMAKAMHCPHAMGLGLCGGI